MNYGNDNKGIAVFNMAIDTLQRLGENLREQRETSSSVLLGKETRQERMLNLVKQFYIQASPLMGVELAELFRERVLSLTTVKEKVLQKNSFGGYINKGERIKYSEALERELNEIMLAIQIALQKKKYFMPPEKDISRGWSQE
jgi:hypothetical protein